MLSLARQLARKCRTTLLQIGEASWNKLDLTVALMSKDGRYFVFSSLARWMGGGARRKHREYPGR